MTCDLCAVTALCAVSLLCRVCRAVVCDDRSCVRVERVWRKYIYREQSANPVAVLVVAQLSTRYARGRVHGGGAARPRAGVGASLGRRDPRPASSLCRARPSAFHQQVVHRQREHDALVELRAVEGGPIRRRVEEG